MSNVPLSLEQLEEIATNVARDLLEKWAIDDRFEEEMSDKYAQFAVDDTLFIINKFMTEFNSHMLAESQKDSLIKN